MLALRASLRKTIAYQMETNFVPRRKNSIAGLEGGLRQSGGLLDAKGGR
jgi:hypothetical protein